MMSFLRPPDPQEPQHTCQIPNIRQTSIRLTEQPMALPAEEKMEGAIWRCGDCGKTWIARVFGPGVWWVPATRREIRRALRDPQWDVIEKGGTAPAGAPVPPPCSQATPPPPPSAQTKIEDPNRALIDLGNSYGEGHPLRELLVGAAYDLRILANVADRYVPEGTKQQIDQIGSAIERHATRRSL